jgi:hypothetical protein
MKKEITIIQENTSPLVINDSDERDLKAYTSDLSKLLESNNVVILETTSCALITRPHKINSIIVRSLETPTQEQPQEEEVKEEIKEEEPSEDIDSDAGIISD